MKKIIIILLLCISLFGCNSSQHNIKQIEQEHLYWKNVKCEIVDYSYNVSAHPFCRCRIKVRNDKYDLEKTFNLCSYDASQMRHFLRRGARSVICKMYTWKYDSTGKITRRELHKIDLRETRRNINTGGNKDG